MSEGYFVPEASGVAELIEKRSRFIGQVWRVESEAEAIETIRQTRAKYHDARHNCWCYLFPDGSMRCSDDGEPQGTAGQPMLEVFRRAGVFHACCVVTRYFGGILLGPGGLMRAYTQAAANALEAAGIARARLLSVLEIPCPYPLFERVKAHLHAFEGLAEEIVYGETIQIRALVPPERTEAFCAGLAELSGGALAASDLGKVYKVLSAVKERW